MCFLVLRQGVATIQAVIQSDTDKISKQMVKFSVGYGFPFFCIVVASSLEVHIYPYVISITT